MRKHLKLISSVDPLLRSDRFNNQRTSASGARTFRLLLALLTVLISDLCLQTESFAQSLQTRADEIRAAMDARDFGRAEELAASLKTSNPAEFALNNYDYLLARLLERRGARADAAVLYQAVISRSSNVAQYALWRLAVLSKASGDLASERQYLSRLLVAYPSSAMAGAARERTIESLLESGEFRAAIPLLRNAARGSGVKARSAVAKLGNALSKSGDSLGARALFNQLMDGSRDDYALAAAEGLDALDESEHVKPDEFEALRRARIYLSNRHWLEARAHLLDIIARFPDSPNRAEALYQTGFTFFREYQHDKAVEWFERAHSEFPEKKEGEQGFYWVGAALQQAKKYDEAARRYADFITAYPQSELLEGAYRNVVDSLRYASKFDQAIEWARKTVARFPDQPLATVGLYNEAKIELTRGNFDRALELLTRVAARPVHAKIISAPIRGEAAFLRVFTLEKMGRTAEAVHAYLAIPDERDNYFGQRATERLRALLATAEGRRVIDPLAKGYQAQARTALASGRYAEAKNAANQALRLAEGETSRNQLLAILRDCYSKLPSYAAAARYRLIPVARPAITSSRDVSPEVSHRALARELMFLGLYEEGVSELTLGGFGDGAENERPRVSQRAAPAGDEANGLTSYSLAVYSNRGNQAYRAIAFGESTSKAIPQDYRIELMPRDLAELIYPAPYRDWFDRYAPKVSVDPRLVLSLARQESRFNPSVKSAAAARGLLQFIPETAQKLASEEGMRGFDLDDVYEPEVAVRLAVRYVANLLKLFPNNPHAVLAAYNTGEQNVERWIARSRSTDVDRLVSEIAIPETKDYVAKVMNSYRAYLALYTEDLRPKTQ